MFKVIKVVTLVLVVAIAALLLYAATRPNTFRVERSTAIKAPPEKIFAVLNDFHRWRAWSPWEKMDPAMKRSFSGTEAGLGAVYTWDGNDSVGAGRMEITESAAPSRVAMALDFKRPFEGHNTAQFILIPQGATTQVTWVMEGPMPFMAKLMTLFLNMDRAIGGDFDKGLANLKTLTEP
jgi:uncharacterized protein YndB with AHSA1/START domain